MKNYMNLLQFEVGRFWKLYIFLVSFTVVSQIIGVILMSRQQLQQAQKNMMLSQLSVTQYMEQYGAISFTQLLYSPWFQLPVGLCVGVLMIYVFFIWYRDWFAKGSFIYRLLMLPTARLTIYFAKLTTIMLFVLGLVAMQSVFIQLELKIFEAMIPLELRGTIPLPVIFSYDFLDLLYPQTLMDFVLLYSVGLLFVAIIFTSILLERSYGLKGIVLAVVYTILSYVFFCLPLIVNSFINYFYPSEQLVLMLITGVVVLGAAIWLAGRLLTYKIKV